MYEKKGSIRGTLDSQPEWKVEETELGFEVKKEQKITMAAKISFTNEGGTKTLSDKQNQNKRQTSSRERPDDPSWQI